MNTKFPKVTLDIDKDTNGSSMSIISAFTTAARKAGWNRNDIYNLIDRARSGNKTHLRKSFETYCE